MPIIAVKKYIKSFVVFAGIALFANIACAQTWHNPNQLEKLSASDLRLWDCGHWEHRIIDKKLGWFWVVGSTFYAYQYPSYPSPYPYLPSPYLEKAQPPEADEPVMHGDDLRRFLCEDTKSYYPYIANCVSWKIVTIPVNPQINETK